MEGKNNISDRIFTAEEIDELLKIVDELDIDDELSEPLEATKNEREDNRALLDFFSTMPGSIDKWVGPDLKYASLYSITELEYSDFIFATINLAEHYISVHDKDIDTNIVMGIDESLLIGLNGDPTINRKTGRSDFNELKITEGIASYLKKNNIVDIATVVKEDKNSEMKHLPEDEPGFVLLYELIPRAATSSGLIYLFIPSKLVKPKIDDIKKINATKDNVSEKLTLTAKLGDIDIDLNDLDKLNEYDIISLNKKANAPVEIYLKDKKLFEGLAIEKEDNTLGVVITKKI